MPTQDTFTRVLGEIKERRDQLRPHVAEMQRLQAADDALDGYLPATSDTKPAVPARRRGRRAKASTASANATSSNRQARAKAPVTATRRVGARRTKGASKEAVLKFMQAAVAPTTTRQVADATGLDPSSVHSILGALTKAGTTQLTKGPTGRKQFTLQAKQ